QDDAAYQAAIGQLPPLSLGGDWLQLVHQDRRPMGTTFAITGVAFEQGCNIVTTLEVSQLADNCDNFAHTRIGPAGVMFPAPPPGEYTIELAVEPPQLFDCALDGALEFEDCSESHWCAPGLICAGITRSPTGLCMDASLRGQFDSGVLDLPISAALVDELQVEGLASVDMDVIVTVHLEHPDPSALTITLTNPATNQVMVWDQEPGPYDLDWYPTPGEIVIERVPVG